MNASDAIDSLERQYRRVYPLLSLSAMFCRFSIAGAIISILIIACVASSIIDVTGVFSGLVVGMSFQLVPIFALNLILAVIFHRLGLVSALLSAGISVAFCASGLVFLLVFSVMLKNTAYLVAGFFALATAIELYLAGVFAVGSYTLFRLTPHSRSLFRDNQKTNWSWTFVRSTGFLPPSFEFVSGRRFFLVTVAAVLGAFLISVGIIWIVAPTHFAAWAIINDFGRIYKEACFHQELCLAELFGRAASPLLLAAGGLLLIPVGMFCQRQVRHLALLSLEDLTRADSRQPILFLRSFRDDQVRLSPRRLSMLGRIAGAGYRMLNLDQMLVWEGSVYGPVVALGNPRDKFPPYGASRGYFANKDWQQAVTNLSRDAALIVICLDNTESIKWEVKHITEEGYVSKTLFIIHPGWIDREEQAILFRNIGERLSGNIDKSEIREELMECNGKALGVFYDSKGYAHVVSASSFSYFATLLMLRQFIRSKYDSFAYTRR